MLIKPFIYVRFSRKNNVSLHNVTRVLRRRIVHNTAADGRVEICSILYVINIRLCVIIIYYTPRRVPNLKHDNLFVLYCEQKKKHNYNNNKNSFKTNLYACATSCKTGRDLYRCSSRVIATSLSPLRNLYNL